MHEYSLVEAMLDQVDAIRIAQRANRVCSIRVGIGEFAGVEPDLFVEAFDVLRYPIETKGPMETKGPIETKGATEAKGASEKFAWVQTDLQMHVIPLEARCDQCHRVFHVEDFKFQCSTCASPDLAILQGEDLILESVTLEGIQE